MTSISDFDYHLPKRFIAQEPVQDREKARLMVLDRTDGSLQHATFADLVSFLNPGDVLVLNDTKVIPARLMARRKRTGGKVEVLLIEPVRDERETNREPDAGESPGTWLAYTKSGGRLLPGEELVVPGAGVSFTLLERRGEEGDLLEVRLPPGASLEELMEKYGHTPLPPYIERGREASDTPLDREYYQTVYADKPGAVAAPTAGMHFTRRLLDEIADRGIEIVYLTLHVGPGTFRPVKTERVEDHVMHSERFAVPPSSMKAILSARSRGNSIVAVGTTVVRTLETVAAGGPGNPELGGRTNIFIRPPHRFRLVDGLVTNFHLPRSTLLMLVSAFAGRERILDAYEEAKRNGYRFFSYGDAMLIL